MRDEAAHIRERLHQLEEIADRLAATCADPVAVADLEAWKAAQ